MSVPINHQCVERPVYGEEAIGVYAILNTGCHRDFFGKPGSRYCRDRDLYYVYTPRFCDRQCLQFTSQIDPDISRAARANSIVHMVTVTKR